MITIITTAMWLILFYTTVRHERKRYNELYKQCLEIRERLARELKKQLKEEATAGFKTSEFKSGEVKRRAE